MRELSWGRRRATALAAALAMAAAVLGTGTPRVSATGGFTFTRIAGQDRYSTAAQLAEAAFTQGASTAIVATGANFPDALGASYLAGAEPGGAPVLLTDPGIVPDATMAALAALGAQKVVIVGGTAAVSDAVATQLAGAGYQVSRIGGPTRYDTMQAVATQPGTAVGTDAPSKRTAILATGTNFPDALGAGPLSYAEHFPLVLTDGTQPKLSPQAAAVLHDLAIKAVVWLGGAQALNPGIKTQLASLGITVDAQLGGSDRTDTAAQLAALEVAGYHFSAAQVALADGANFPDALAGGPAGGVSRTPTLLTEGPDKLGDPTGTYLSAHAPALTAGTVYGGSAAVSDAVVAEATADGASASSQQGFIVSPSAATTSPEGANVEVSAGGLGTTPVDAVLFACGNVTVANGTVTFSPAGGASGRAATAAPGTTTAQITQVNGASVTPGPAVDGITPANGSVTLTVSDASAGCAVPVVFTQTSPSDTTLALDARGAPTQTFGVGGALTFLPPEGTPSITQNPNPTLPSPGSGWAIVSQFSTAQGYVVAAVPGHPSYTYYFSSGSTPDTDQLVQGSSQACASDSLSDFQTRLSVGDAVSGYYQASPSGTSTPGTSTFCLDDIAPAAPSSVTITTGTSANTVTWNDSATPSAVSYNVYKAVVTSGSCPALPSPALSPQAPPAGSPWLSPQANLADPDPGTASSATLSWTDTAVTPETTDCYAVAAVDASGQPGSAMRAIVGSGPFMESASVGLDPNGVLDTVTVTYNEPVMCSSVDASSDQYSVSYLSGATAPQPASASCSGTTNAIVTLTVPAPSNAPGSSFTGGDRLVVTAQDGSSGMTPTDANGNAEAVGDTLSAPIPPAFGSMQASLSENGRGHSTITLVYNGSVTCSSSVNGADFGIHDATAGDMAFTSGTVSCPGTDTLTLTDPSTTGDTNLVSATKAVTVTVTWIPVSRSDVVADANGNTQPQGSTVSATCASPSSCP